MSDVTDRHDALWAGNRKEMEEILAALDEPAKEEARLWALRSDAAAGVANFGQMTHITPVTAVPQCMCKDRALSECPGEWEPGCDLGANPAHVGYATPEETAEAFKDLREVSAIFQDAERYRWLRNSPELFRPFVVETPTPENECKPFGDKVLTGQDLDEAIDAAMKEKA